MKNSPINILMIAYACRPGEVSERQVGWYWSKLIQTNHKVTVLTRESHRPYIEKWIEEGREAGPFPEFIYYDLPYCLSWYKKGERGVYLYYALWMLLATLRCRWINRSGRWQITHFLTFGTVLWPQFGFLMNTPYVLGPVGGGERIPVSLRKSFNITGQVKIIARRVVQLLMLFNPIFWANLCRASHVFARTGETLDMIPERFRSKTSLLLETAILSEMIPNNPPTRSNEVLQIVSVGRLITSKFNPLFLEVLAEFKSTWQRPFHVTVVGDGPERLRLEALRDRLGLEEVEFVGAKTNEQVHEVLRSADIYFSTTMKEGGTWAFFEAVANYLPIVCLKVNGPDMIVGDECGIKIQPDSIDSARDGLMQGLIDLAENPVLRSDFADKAISHLKANFTWQHVSAVVENCYNTILTNEVKQRS